MEAMKERKKLNYLSPTSIMTWRRNPEEFYLNYLALDKPPRMAQTQPMSVGSAFDARIKEYLAWELEGKKLDLFEAQVESQNRDFARVAGLVCFDAYKQCGALSDLMLMLRGGQIKLEFTVSSEKISKTFGEAVLLGKPDAYFTFDGRTDIILDWKVTGYCSLSTSSPTKGYCKIRSSDGTSKEYKNSFLTEHHGVVVNSLWPMDTIKEDWALQTCIYSWLCGAPIGSDFIVAIDQLVCNKDIKVAQFRSIISPEYQYKLYDEIGFIWNTVNSDWVFRNMNEEDSIKRCLMLDERALALRMNPEFSQLI
jgi:hypothetical protein